MIGDETVPMALYSAALDEVWALRRALAYEASVAEVHGEYKTFPQSRRRFLAEQVERMRRAARGEAERAYASTNSRSIDHALREAGASQTLTRFEWEAGRAS